MRLAYDATALLGPRTGVGVFTAEVLERVAARPDIDVVAYGVTWRGRDQLAEVVPDGVEVARRPMAARPLRATWRRSDQPPIEWFTGTVDVVHGPNFVVPPTRSAAALVTIHDLTCLRFPELCTADTLEYPDLIRRALARGATVHAVSHAVAAEIVDAFALDPARVVVVPNGVRPLAAPGPDSDAAAGRALIGADRYILALGTVEPRKDLPTLVRAFDEVAARDRDLRLVIAGPDGWGLEDVVATTANSPNRRRIVRLGWVPDERRAGLLRGACAYAFPSIYEGFGLPPLEAMAAGVPVVTTTAGALPEVVDDAAALVPPGDPDALAAALEHVLTDEAYARTLIERGLERAALFTWDATADGLIDLYERLAPPYR